MKTMVDMQTQTVTLQARLPRGVDATVVAALDAYAALFSRLERVYLAAVTRGDRPVKPRFMQDHGISGRQFNAIKRAVEGMVASAQSNLPRQQAQLAAKLERLEKKLTKDRNGLALAKPPRRKARLAGAVKQRQRRVQILEARLAALTQQLESGRPRICQGSRRLFNAQHHLDSNGFASHDQWKQAWRNSRSNHIFVLGSKDETAGCQGCTIYPQADGADERYTLRLRLPRALQGEHGDCVYLTDITFSYQKEVLDTAIARNRERAGKQAEWRRLKKAGATEQKEAEFLSAFGQAISYRFVRDDRRGWRVLLSTDLRAPKATFDPQTGVVAVDFNAEHLSVAELDARGNKVVAWDIGLSDLQATSNQNRTQLEAAALEVVAHARATGKPVVMENLDFARKKAGMLKGERGAQAYQRMLSRLSWQAFAQALTMQCLRNAVALKAVNPAFTSLIGELKFSSQTAFNGHQAAAIVIGRRGMGKSDRLPRQCVVRPGGCARPFTPPEDGVEDEPRALKKTARVYRQWCAADREARSLRRRTRRQQRASARAGGQHDPRACAAAAS